jgi:hypothetical protein
MTRKRSKRPPQTEEQRVRILGRLRIGDLNKLFAYRYRGTRESWQFTDDDAGREDLEIYLHHYAITNSWKAARTIKLRVPWMEVDEARSLLDRVEACPRRWRAHRSVEILTSPELSGGCCVFGPSLLST